MNEFGYSRWQFIKRVGARPQFGFAGATATGKCHFTKKESALLWRTSLSLLRQMAQANGSLNGWLQHAEASRSKHSHDDPLVGLSLSLLGSVGLPDYPLEASCGDDGTISVEHACPYDCITVLALELTSILLGWSHAAIRMPRFSLQNSILQAWIEQLSVLTGLLPPKDVMLFHHQLWERGINWQWLGGERTRVGQGVNQRIFENVPSGPFGEPDSFRIPIYTVTGSVGKTTTARLLFQLLRATGKRVALTDSNGAWMGDECMVKGDCIGGVTAMGILRQPEVEAAVFEQGRSGILGQGVPYAHSEVAVLLNVMDVHVGFFNINTVTEMADVKAMGIKPARLAVLNLDDAQCRRLGGERAGKSCVWFSVGASSEILASASLTSTGALGVQRGADGQPLALQIWQAGQLTKRLSLENVRPYHGFLGKKTLEELLAAVGAAWFGPLPVPKWDERLPFLRLDSRNHAFRSSVHRLGNTFYLLDKSADPHSLAALSEIVESICEQERITHRMVVLTRLRSERAEVHLASCRKLHAFMDEFACFDRPAMYESTLPLPFPEPGSLPKMLAGEFLRLNAQSGCDKPVRTFECWDHAEAFILERLSTIQGKVLVLINQTAGDVELNKRILQFVSKPQNPPS